VDGESSGRAGVHPKDLAGGVGRECSREVVAISRQITAVTLACVRCGDALLLVNAVAVVVVHDRPNDRDASMRRRPGVLPGATHSRAVAHLHLPARTLRLSYERPGLLAKVRARCPLCCGRGSPPPRGVCGHEQSASSMDTSRLLHSLLFQLRFFGTVHPWKAERAFSLLAA